MKVVMLDAYNLIHRARSGYTKGDHAIVYNFFRGIRPLIELHNPDRVYFVLEGVPKHRLELLPTYKGDRVSPGDSFHNQKRIIISLIRSAFPFQIMQADHLECDDLIGNLARYHDEKGDAGVIVSGDSDFIQVLDVNPSVQLYHPIKKAFIEKPDYHYLTWKALCGDKTDNIPGIKGVGSKTAEKLCKDLEKMDTFLQINNNRAIFERNLGLIAFPEIAGFRPCDYTPGPGELHEGRIRECFEHLGFSSILKESTWKKYTETFRSLR
jgi:DNA polymerase-1